MEEVPLGKNQGNFQFTETMLEGHEVQHEK